MGYKIDESISVRFNRLQSREGRCGSGALTGGVYCPGNDKKLIVLFRSVQDSLLQGKTWFDLIISKRNVDIGNMRFHSLLAGDFLVTVAVSIAA